MLQSIGENLRLYGKINRKAENRIDRQCLVLLLRKMSIIVCLVLVPPAGIICDTVSLLERVKYLQSHEQSWFWSFFPYFSFEQSVHCYFCFSCKVSFFCFSSPLLVSLFY